MKVKYLIKQLKEYNPDDELIVAYWTKAWFSELLECDITDEQWLDIADAGNDVIDAGAGDDHRTSTGQLLEQHGLLAANQLHQRDDYGGGHPLLQVGEALGLVIAPAHRHPIHHGAGAASDIGHRKAALRAGQQGGHANGRD